MAQKGLMVTRVALADAFGVALTTVDSWVRAGCPYIQRGGRGRDWKFNTADVGQWRCDRARDEVLGKTQASEEELKLRKLAAEAEKAELELAKAKGEVAPVREFERATSALMAVIRQNVMQVPGRAVMQLIGCNDETEFKSKLRAELVLALESAAEEELALDDDEDQPGSDD